MEKDWLLGICDQNFHIVMNQEPEWKAAFSRDKNTIKHSSFTFSYNLQIQGVSNLFKIFIHSVPDLTQFLKMIWDNP